MSRKPKKFKVHGPNRKPPPNPPTVPRDLIPAGVPRYDRNYSKIRYGKAQFLVLAVMAAVLGAVLIATKEAPWQVCLPLIIIVVVIGLLLFLFSKNR